MEGVRETTTGRASADFEGVAVESEVGAADGSGTDELGVAAPTTGTSRSAESVRAERARRDQQVFERAMASLLALDPTALQEYFQSRVRDQSLRTQEDGLRSADARGARQAEIREAQYEAAEAAERARQEADFFGAIFKAVAVVVSAIVNAIGAIGSVFSGGASLVATVALTVALLGPLIVNGLAEAGVIDDPQIAATINAVIATVAAVCSFGAGTASAVAAVASAIAAAAPNIMQHLASAGVLDAETAAIVGTVIAVVASLVACGSGIGAAAESASRAGAQIADSASRAAAQVADSASRAGAEIAEQVLQQVQNGLRVAEAAARAGQGGAQIGSAVHQREHDDRVADAHQADANVQMQLDAMQECSEALGDIMRAARRVAQRMQETREELYAAMSAAANVYARA